MSLQSLSLSLLSLSLQVPPSYPLEVGKTALSLAFLGLGFMVTTFSLALTHEVGVLYTKLYTVHCTLYTVHCSLYTVHCTLYTVHYTIQCTVNSIAHSSPAPEPGQFVAAPHPLLPAPAPSARHGSPLPPPWRRRTSP